MVPNKGGKNQKWLPEEDRISIIKKDCIMESALGLLPHPRSRLYSFFALNGAFCGWPGRGERLLRAKLFRGGAGARNKVQSRTE